MVSFCELSRERQLGLSRVQCLDWPACIDYRELWTKKCLYPTDVLLIWSPGVQLMLPTLLANKQIDAVYDGACDALLRAYPMLMCFLLND